MWYDNTLTSFVGMFLIRVFNIKFVLIKNFSDIWLAITIWFTILYTVVHIVLGLLLHRTLSENNKGHFIIPILTSLYGLIVGFVVCGVLGSYINLHSI